jgi:hypothetical protein
MSVDPSQPHGHPGMGTLMPITLAGFQAAQTTVVSQPDPPPSCWVAVADCSVRGDRLQALRPYEKPFIIVPTTARDCWCVRKALENTFCRYRPTGLIPVYPDADHAYERADWLSRNTDRRLRGVKRVSLNNVIVRDLEDVAREVRFTEHPLLPYEGQVFIAWTRRGLRVLPDQ